MRYALRRNFADLDARVLTEAERRERDRANIVAALEACGGRIFGRSGAAALLGVKPTTLVSRIKSLGVRIPRSASGRRTAPLAGPGPLDATGRPA